jgi:hypothetical protein
MKAELEDYCRGCKDDVEVGKIVNLYLRAYLPGLTHEFAFTLKQCRHATPMPSILQPGHSAVGGRHESQVQFPASVACLHRSI